jgi:hypothetical protein
MSRFRVGLAVTAVLLTIGFLVVAWVMKRPGGPDAPKLPEPVSYAKPSPDGKRVFVAHGSVEYETKLKDAATREFAAGVRAKYPTPGMYSAGDPPTALTPTANPRPLAAVTGVAAAHADPAWWWDRYTPDDNVFLTNDGAVAVRIEGEWWKTKAYVAGKRLPEEVEQAQLNAPAVSFLFADGRPPRTYLLNELVDTPAELPHSPEHVLWPAGAALDPRTNQFHLFTQDSNKITFDATTGEVVHKGKNGLGNPVAQTLIGITLGLTAVLGVVLAWYVVKARPRATTNS